jgi:dTDP-4-dehydrorhamnose 3,5-epimerase-like enzyme
MRPPLRLMIPCTLVDLPTFTDSRGVLTVLDGLLPFPIVRCYWIYGADGHLRGGHRHHRTRQALIALSGEVVVHLDDGREQGDVVLDCPARCLLVEPRHWHTMRFSEGALLLVLSSHPYDRDDYSDEPYRR